MITIRRVNVMALLEALERLKTEGVEYIDLCEDPKGDGSTLLIRYNNFYMKRNKKEKPDDLDIYASIA